MIFFDQSHFNLPGRRLKYFNLYHKLLIYFNIVFKKSQVIYGKNLQNFKIYSIKYNIISNMIELLFNLQRLESNPPILCNLLQKKEEK